MARTSRSANRTATKLCRHTTYGWALYDRTNILTDRGFDWTYFLPAVVYRVVPTDLRKAAVGVGIPGNIGRRLSHHRGARYQGIPDQGDSASHGVHRLLQFSAQRRSTSELLRTL